MPVTAPLVGVPVVTVPSMTPVTVTPVPVPLVGVPGATVPACTAAPIPSAAVLGTEIWFSPDGSVGADRVVSYEHAGVWTLRIEMADGSSSELDFPAAGVFGVTPLGFADIDSTTPSAELLASVGGGASAIEVGVFSVVDGCIERYQWSGGGDFRLNAGATVGHGSGIFCGPGYIAAWQYAQLDDNTYTVYTLAYEVTSFPVLGYMPSSDDFVDGLSYDEVSGRSLIDCGTAQL